MLTDFLDEFSPWNDLEEFAPQPDSLEIPRLIQHGKQNAISLGFWKLENHPRPESSIKESLAIILKNTPTSSEPPDRFSNPEIDLEKDGTMNFSTDEEVSSLFSIKRTSTLFDFFDITDGKSPPKDISFGDTGSPSNSVDEDILNLEFAAKISKFPRPLSTGTFSEYSFLAAEIDLDSFDPDNPNRIISTSNVLSSDLSPITHSANDNYLISMSFSSDNPSNPDQNMTFDGNPDPTLAGPNYTYSIDSLVRSALPKRQCPTPPHDLAKARHGRITKRPRKKTKLKRTFDYSFAQVHYQLEPAPQLQNYAKLPDPGDTGHESQLVSLQDQDGCVINRSRYIRGSLECLAHLHKNVSYERNEFFNVSHPYQQEFTRVETDQATGLPINETRSGLCPYCAELSFYELKNSSYAQHLSHSHGIFTDNFLTPNPLNIGHYAVAKSTNSPRKTTARVRSHEGVVCPACYKVVEIRCWTSTLEKKPLSNYLRHFKEEHRVGKNRSSYFREQT